MKEKLLSLLECAYAPYSNFKVACIIKMKDGSYVGGVNVENASYGATICAERNAITNAISLGYKKGDFLSLYVMTSSGNYDSPCFLCRQVIVEFFDPTSEIILVTKEGDDQAFKVSDLCPYPFNSDNLKGEDS